MTSAGALPSDLARARRDPSRELHSARCAGKAGRRMETGHAHRLPFHSHTQADRSARCLLGSDHTLVRALHRSGLAVERSLVVTGLMCMSATAWLEGLAGALAVLVAAAAVQVALGCEWALTVQRCRECARD